MALLKAYKWFTTSRMPLFLACVLFALSLFLQSGGMENLNYLHLGVDFLLGVGTALLLQQLNHQYILFGSKTFLPALLYLLYLSSDSGNIATHNLLSGLFFVLSLFFLFRTYQDTSSRGSIFNISLLFGLSSLFWPPFLLLLPLVWIGMWRAQSLTLKTFLASLLGIIVVGMGIFAWSVYQNNIGICFYYLPDWERLTHIEFLPLDLYEYILYGYLLLLFIVASSNLFLFTKSSKVRTKVILEYFSFIGLLLFALLALFIYQEKGWNVLLFVPLSYLCTHFFTTHSGKKSAVYFFLTLLLLLASAVISVGSLNC